MRRVLVGALVGALTLGFASGARAGTVQKRVLSLAEARAVAAAASAEATRLHAGGAIAIVDDGGHLVYLERLDGTFPAAASVATAKARTAATFRRPTSDFESAVRGGRTSLVAVDEMTPLQGGLPILQDGEVVGAIGVSGAASAQQDEDIARAAVAAVATQGERR
jgi:glc operon protein GlcG